jgi:hypothetical protein
MTYRDSQRFRKVYSYYRPVPRPSDNTGGVDKAYVDGIVAGLDWKQSVRFASTANINLGAPGLIDGGTLANEDRVLLLAQGTLAENGIYIYYTATNSLIRTLDGEQDTLTCGAAVYVEEGSTLSQTVWILVTNDPITVNTTPQIWSQFSAGGSIFTTSGLKAKTPYSATFGGSGYVSDIGTDVFFFLLIQEEHQWQVLQHLEETLLSQEHYGFKEVQLRITIDIRMHSVQL